MNKATGSCHQEGSLEESTVVNVSYRSLPDVAPPPTLTFAERDSDSEARPCMICPRCSRQTDNEGPVSANQCGIPLSLSLTLGEWKILRITRPRSYMM